MYFEETEWDKMDWNHMAQDSLAVAHNSLNRHVPKNAENFLAS